MKALGRVRNAQVYLCEENATSNKTTVTNMPDTQEPQMKREPRTGIDILVVGGGIGGLTFAIEAHRKGHHVRVLERNDEGQYSGTCLPIQLSTSKRTKLTNRQVRSS